MSAAPASPNPSNLILLAVLGIGAYWFMTQRATAATRAAVPSNGQGGIMPSSGYATASVLKWAANDKNLWSGVSKILGGGATPQQTAGYYAANNSFNGVGSSTPASPSDDNSVFPDWGSTNPSPSGWNWNEVPYGSM